MAFGVCNQGAVDLDLRYGRVRHFARWFVRGVPEPGGTRRSAADSQLIFSGRNPPRRRSNNQIAPNTMSSTAGRMATARNDVCAAMPSTRSSSAPGGSAVERGFAAGHLDLLRVVDRSHHRQHEPDRQRAGRAHQTHQQRAAARKPLRRRRQHRRPHVADAGAPDRRREQARERRVRGARARRDRAIPSGTRPTAARSGDSLCTSGPAKWRMTNISALTYTSSRMPGMCTVRLSAKSTHWPGRELGRGRQEHRAEQHEEQRVEQLAEHLAHRDAGRRALGRRKPDADARARRRRAPAG